MTLYFGTHILGSPVSGRRSLVYRIAKAEMFDHSDFAGIRAMTKRLYNYNLPY